MKLWIARNRIGKLFIYQQEPIYEFCIDSWLSDYQRLSLEVFDFPEITFENSPQEVELKLVGDGISN